MLQSQSICIDTNSFGFHKNTEGQTLFTILLSEFRKDAQGHDQNPEDSAHKPKAEGSQC